EDDALEDAGILQRESLTDHPAHREADPVRSRDPQLVEEPLDVVGELFERVRPRRRAALSMTAGVEAQHLELVREDRHLVIPHVEVAREGVTHREPGSCAFNGVVDVDSVRAGLHSCLIPACWMSLPHFATSAFTAAANAAGKLPTTSTPAFRKRSVVST